jgi:hypothetical protein
MTTRHHTQATPEIQGTTPAAVPFGAPVTPGDHLAGTVIEAVSALFAISDAMPDAPPHVGGLLHAVKFIANGLRDAVCEFEEAQFSEMEAAEGAEA